MARFPERGLIQKCVYWGNPVSDGYGGFTYDDPVELSCRWLGTSKIIKDAKGQEIVSRAEIQVTQDLKENGMLFLGTLNDLDSAGEENPNSVEGAYVIIRVDKMPTVKGRFFRRAYL